jgi:urea ABC transporter urea binding protein
MTNIFVGILHSLNGAMAISETPLVDAAIMAIAEINQSGGVLGHQVKAIVEDGASDPEIFAEKAESLICGDRVASVFGCWTSLCRKTIKPIFEAYNALLWYPIQYEGLEQSPNIFYTGSCLNQQIEPSVNWLLANGKRNFYLLGSDYVFPRTANQYIKGQLRNQGGLLVGEKYAPLGGMDFMDVVEEIHQLCPDVVFSTLNGNSNIAFYEQYARSGILATEIPIMAVSVSEVELEHIGSGAVGHYASWNYFQSLDLDSNRQFVKNFRDRYGAFRVTSDPIASAYTQIYLWKALVEKAQSFEVNALRTVASGTEIDSPCGQVRVETNQHLWKHCRIGQVQPDGSFAIVHSSPAPINPLPWLGVEVEDFPAQKTAIALLGQVSQGIQYSWQLEKQSKELESTLEQLKTEIAERERSQSELAKANAEITLLNQKLSADNLRMGAELEVTRSLQQMILPDEAELNLVPELDISGFMEPADEVGGDYYDVLLGGGAVKIGIGDITGHGLESGVLMIMVQTAIRTLLACDVNDPVKFLSILNRIIYDNAKRMGSDKNLSLTLLDYKNGKLDLSGQHEEVLFVSADGMVERIDTIDLGFPIGLEADASQFFASFSLNLPQGGGVVLYTDGVTEADSPLKEQYGVDRLCTVIGENWQQSASTIRSAIIADLRSHIGAQKVYDDITLLVLKRK